MHKAQRQAEEFHRAVGLTVGESPDLRDAELRVALVLEEAGETATAIRDSNLVEAIDGLCDLIYVAYGAAVTFGIDLEPFFDAVHQANMTKVGGPIRSDGKRLKPANWQEANLSRILEDQQALRSGAGGG